MQCWRQLVSAPHQIHGEGRHGVAGDMKLALLGLAIWAAMMSNPGLASAQDAGSASSANDSMPKPEPHIVPLWRSKATGDDLMRVFPKEALRHGVEGIALIRCGVTSEGRMTNCAVEQEAPTGYGFGEAALALMPRFRMKAKTDGGAPVGGGVVRLPIQFRLPG